MSNVNDKLFGMIQYLDYSEKDIHDYIDKNIKSLNPNYVKKNSECNVEESLLMWAVWNVRSSVVQRLIEMGADVKYTNRDGESASTYWNIDSETVWGDDELGKSVVIAYLLHIAGCDLSKPSYVSYDLITRAIKYNINEEFTDYLHTKLGYPLLDKFHSLN